MAKNDEQVIEIVKKLKRCCISDLKESKTYRDANEYLSQVSILNRVLKLAGEADTAQEQEYDELIRITCNKFFTMCVKSDK